MINLYKVLHLSPYASESEIRLALQEMETSLNERTIKAVYEWLLVDSVRARYDMKLRETYPDYFAQFRVPVAQNGGNFAKKNRWVRAEKWSNTKRLPSNMFIHALMCLNCGIRMRR